MQWKEIIVIQQCQGIQVNVIALMVNKAELKHMEEEEGDEQSEDDRELQQREVEVRIQEEKQFKQ